MEVLGLVGVQSQLHGKEDRDEKDCDMNEWSRQFRSLPRTKDSRPFVLSLDGTPHHFPDSNMLVIKKPTAAATA